MIQITTILLLIAWPYIGGYCDGYFKRNSTVFHTAKLINRFAKFALLFTALNGYLDMYVFAGMLLIEKPLFDFGYSKGAKVKNIYGKVYDLWIGTTDWSDRLIRKIGLFKNNKLNAVLWSIYVVLTFMGIGLMGTVFF